MKGKTPNKAEKEWLDKITQFGCIVCRLYYFVFSPGEVHHLNGGDNHRQTICLCDRHHRNPRKGYETRHGNKARFDAAYGDDWSLLRKTEQLMEAAA